MLTLKRAAFKYGSHDPNWVHILWFDPGGTTGWARITVTRKAFSRPEHFATGHLVSWDCGEFSGSELDVKNDCYLLMRTLCYPQNNRRAELVAGTEQFDLIQTRGSAENLLSPVRINSVLEWEASKLSLPLIYQGRSERVQNTPERLREYGFQGRWSKTGKGKDAFAAMQHCVLWLRKMKVASVGRPWMLASDTSPNGYWDCACTYKAGFNAKCDLRHPR